MQQAPAQSALLLWRAEDCWRGSLWSRRELSFDLTEEFGLDFKKAFKTTIQHFGVPKWTLESTRKPQVAFGQKESGERWWEVSRGRQRSTEAGPGHTMLKDLQYL